MADCETVQMMNDVASENRFEDRYVLKPVEVGHRSSLAEEAVEEAVDDWKDMTLRMIHLAYVVQMNLYFDYAVKADSRFESVTNGRFDVEIVVGDSSVAEEAVEIVMARLELYSSVE